MQSHAAFMRTVSGLLPDADTAVWLPEMLRVGPISELMTNRALNYLSLVPDTLYHEAFVDLGFSPSMVDLVRWLERNGVNDQLAARLYWVPIGEPGADGRTDVYFAMIERPVSYAWASTDFRALGSIDRRVGPACMADLWRGVRDSVVGNLAAVSTTYSGFSESHAVEVVDFHLIKGGATGVSEDTMVVGKSHKPLGVFDNQGRDEITLVCNGLMAMYHAGLSDVAHGKVNSTQRGVGASQTVLNGGYCYLDGFLDGYRERARKHFASWPELASLVEDEWLDRIDWDEVDKLNLQHVVAGRLHLSRAPGLLTYGQLLRALRGGAGYGLPPGLWSFVKDFRVGGSAVSHPRSKRYKAGDKVDVDCPLDFHLEDDVFVDVVFMDWRDLRVPDGLVVLATNPVDRVRAELDFNEIDVSALLLSQEQDQFHKNVWIVSYTGEKTDGLVCTHVFTSMTNGYQCCYLVGPASGPVRSASEVWVDVSVVGLGLILK